MIKDKFKHISIDLYHYDLYFSLLQTDKELKKSLKSEGFENDDINYILDPENSKYSAALCFMNREKQTVVIRILKDEDQASLIKHISHEVFHAVYFILNNAGLVLSSDSEEAFAYLTGYITYNIIKDV